MRYLYDGFKSYREQMGPITRMGFSLAAGRLRRWDTMAAQRVTHFIANSNYVADRIKRVYGRSSEVIYPPIDLNCARDAVAGDHYLCAGRLVGYKRTELALKACARLGRPIRVAGAGPEEARLRQLAGSANITFLGELSTESLWQQYAQCRALLFSADEDFGMIPLEVQACGRPVIAYGVGGSLETVRGISAEISNETATGVYFPKQTVESLMEAIQQFEAAEANGVFHSSQIKAWARNFDTEIFLQKMRSFILSVAPKAEGVMSLKGKLD
jgi:glycosyltransferase involved in cell wall biosynthesis